MVDLGNGGPEPDSIGRAQVLTSKQCPFTIALEEQSIKFLEYCFIVIARRKKQQFFRLNSDATKCNILEFGCFMSYPV